MTELWERGGRQRGIIGEIRWNMRSGGDDSEGGGWILFGLGYDVLSYCTLCTHIQLRASSEYFISPLHDSPFANQFPVFKRQHFLVYESYEAELWLWGRAPLFTS